MTNKVHKPNKRSTLYIKSLTKTENTAESYYKLSNVTVKCKEVMCRGHIPKAQHFNLIT